MCGKWQLAPLCFLTYLSQVTDAPRQMDSFLKISLGKFSLKIMRLLDDYLFTSICFWEHWFPLENKLCFLNFPVGARDVLVQKSPQVKTMHIFYRDSVSRDCGKDQFIENKDKVKILNKV